MVRLHILTVSRITYLPGWFSVAFPAVFVFLNVLLLSVLPNCRGFPLKPRSHDTTGCQTGFQIGLTTGCIVYTNIQPATGLTTGCIMYTAGCQTGCTTRFDNRLNDEWLFVQTVVKPVVKPVDNRFDNRLYRVNGV